MIIQINGLNIIFKKENDATERITVLNIYKVKTYTITPKMSVRVMVMSKRDNAIKPVYVNCGTYQELCRVCSVLDKHCPLDNPDFDDSLYQDVEDELETEDNRGNLKEPA